MAKLVYDKDGRLLFTKEMKEEYTILMPQMLPVHFGMFRQLLELEGYKVDMLTTNHRGIVDEGLKYVHNDTCYPAAQGLGQGWFGIRPRHLRQPVRAGEKSWLDSDPVHDPQDDLRHDVRRSDRVSGQPGSPL